MNLHLPLLLGGGHIQLMNVFTTMWNQIAGGQYASCLQFQPLPSAPPGALLARQHILQKLEAPEVVNSVLQNRENFNHIFRFWEERCV